MKLKEIRMDRNLKVQEVAEYLCCSPSVYGRYENEKREPSIDILRKLSKLYDVSVDYLIGNETEVNSTSLDVKLIKALHQADDRAKKDALALLELHKS